MTLAYYSYCNLFYCWQLMRKLAKRELLFNEKTFRSPRVNIDRWLTAHYHINIAIGFGIDIIYINTSHMHTIIFITAGWGIWWAALVNVTVNTMMLFKKNYLHCFKVNKRSSIRNKFALQHIKTITGSCTVHRTTMQALLNYISIWYTLADFFPNWNFLGVFSI